MNEMTTYRWSFLEDVSAYQDAGLNAIGIWRPKLVEFGEERGIELIRDSGLAVSSLSWAGGFTGSNEHSFLEALDDARDAVRVGGALNAECLVIISGSRAGHTVNHSRRLLVDALRSLGDLAAEHQLPLAVQPMHSMFTREWTFLTTIDQTLDVLDRCDHEYVQLAFDVYHLWQEPRLLERIPQIASRVAVVQLSDWSNPPRSENDRCLPGDGEIPLNEIVTAFAESDYEGHFELEVWSQKIWNSDYQKLLATCRSRFGDLFCR